MSVDPKNKHFECTKCGHQVSSYPGNKKFSCNSGGSCNFKTVNAHWDNSALGATANLLGRGLMGGARLAGKGISAGANSISEHNSEEARENREQLRIQKDQEREINSANRKIKDQETAATTLKVYGAIKPYLKYIIPVYLLGFLITFLMAKNQKLVGIFFGLSIAIVAYFIYNAIVNKPKSE